MGTPRGVTEGSRNESDGFGPRSSKPRRGRSLERYHGVVSHSARAREVLDLALELGFDLAGIAPLRAPMAGRRFQNWLAAGHHADMRWLEEQAERILDPRLSLIGGRSLLAVGLGHARSPVELGDGGRVARYAAGRDYHNVMGRKLRRMASALRGRGLLGEWKKVVDAGPLLERSHAAEAGLGFESKAANLLNPRFGPWFFLGELLLDVELEPTSTPPVGSCGTCTACLTACPTGAILEPGVVDARLCLSYQTIENRGQVPHELRAAIGGWVFGCDVCSEVCPWGKDAPDASARFGLLPAIEEGSLSSWLGLSTEAFAERFAGSPLQRTGRDGLARNAALALGNLPSDSGRAALEEALDDPSPLVREATFWGLARGHRGELGVDGALQRALEAESDPGAKAGMARTRAEVL
ncbi:MAG: tRNA epoxyqueuosine(34) reductase QueG [Planctomycetes bacterium]|nr:tRNA epoxyqueuosine(34) reductase QueG [Planctomycetota bacterium]